MPRHSGAVVCVQWSGRLCRARFGAAGHRQRLPVARSVRLALPAAIQVRAARMHAFATLPQRWRLQ